MGNLEDLLGAIVPILFVIFWVVSQVMAGINRARKQPPAAEAPEGDRERTADDELAREIERFLGKTQNKTEQPDSSPRPTTVDSEPVITAEAVAPRRTAMPTPVRRPARRKKPARKRRQPQGNSTNASDASSTKGADPVDQGEQSIVHLPDAEDEMQNLMGDPATVRRAFLLSQIFSRPEDRW